MCRHRCWLIALWSVLVLVGSVMTSRGAEPELGMFQGFTNVGEIAHSGSLELDDATTTYTLSGSGANIWGTTDAFAYAWTRHTGDLRLQADINWVGQGIHEHRKAGWMIRAGLEPDDPYADAVLHGDGLISLQFRRHKGGPTEELRSGLTSKATLLLQRTGEQVSMAVLDAGREHPVGTISLNLPEQVYAGIVVCSHDPEVVETARLSNLVLEATPPVPTQERIIESTLEIIDVATGVRRVRYRARDHFEAPNWSPDGTTLYYNSHGLLYTLGVSSGDPVKLDTGYATHCNNDHGLSPDGSRLVVSHQADDGASLIYLLPATGGTPMLVTEKGPSYWHGWSPDGTTLAYCAERNGEYDVYTIPVTGGQEQRLTTAPGLDDGPDYSPDGTFIYFNSVRTGQMKIWRMKADGAEQTQITPDDEYGDWFAHPSPDGKWLVFVSYHKSVEGHPPNKDVVLRLMPADLSEEPWILATLFGGQGTINVPSWSPDSTEVAFVSYRLVAP